MGNISGAQHSQLAHGLKPDVFALVGDVTPWPTLAVGPVDDFVVDVGDVGDQPHLNAPPGQISPQDVVHQGGAPMAQMGWAVHRGATQIDAECAGLAHSEGQHALGGGVIEVQHSDKPTI